MPKYINQKALLANPRLGIIAPLESKIKIYTYHKPKHDAC